MELKKQQQKARLQKTQRVSRRPPEFATPPTLDSADETGEEKSDTAGKTIPPISMLPAEGNEITPEQQSRAANVIQRMQQIARQAGLLPAHPQKQKPAAAKPEVAAATKQAAPPLTGPGSSIFLWEALSTVWFDFSFVSLSYIHIHFFAVWFSQGKILGKRFVEPDGLQTVVFGGILLVELFIGLIILTLLSILVAVYNAVFSSWGWDRFVTVYSLLSEIPFTKILFDWLSSAV